MAHLTYVYDNSDSLTLIGYYTEEIWHPTPQDVPAYLVEAFVQPLTTRQQEREAMAALGGEDGLELPDEASGRYTGTIVAAGVHYLVQEVIEDGFITLYRHDALWLTHQPQQDWTGKTALICYGKAEYGLATVFFP